MKWQTIGIAEKLGAKYLIMKFPDYDKAIYNIIREGEPMPTGGYYNLESIMKLKGITGFTKIS